MEALHERDKELALEGLPAAISQLEAEIGKVIIGQRDIVRQIVIALLCGGHCLLRGVPGLAKTLLVKTLAQAIQLNFNRVQFTPDLMPSDITGTEVIEEDHTTGRRIARFIRGPIFTNILLADEINRSPPKTQAALLEAMQEKQVTVSGLRYQLDEPFFVLATQNPIEQEGTYNLPEAQLDRFLFELVMDYPTAAEECRIVSETTTNAAHEVRAIVTGTMLQHWREIVRDIPAAENVVEYATRLVRATRPGTAEAIPFVSQNVRWGAGPRAGQAILLGAKATALLDGRFAVGFEDIMSMALPVLRHRVLPNFRAEAEGVTPAQIIDDLLRTVSSAPRQ
ncbi:MAG: MoxR family ATPase [Pyrinomonadaceae bacterium]